MRAAARTLVSVFPQTHSPGVSSIAMKAVEPLAAVPEVADILRPLGERRALALTQAEIEKKKRKFHAMIWTAMARRSDWNSWEQHISLFRQHGIAYDEITYTFLIHGYLLSHRHRSENALLVLEEMRHAGIHPALIKLNESLVNSYFELLELKCRPNPSSWQNVCRLCWQTAKRYQKKRVKRLKAELDALPANDVLRITQEDIQARYRFLARDPEVDVLPEDEPREAIPGRGGRRRSRRKTPEIDS